MVLTPVKEYFTALTPSLVAEQTVWMMMMLSKLLPAVRRSVLVFRQAARTAVQMQLLCRMEAMVVAESGAAGHLSMG